jgi:hypothetical protein
LLLASLAPLFRSTLHARIESWITLTRNGICIALIVQRQIWMPCAYDVGRMLNRQNFSHFAGWTKENAMKCGKKWRGSGIEGTTELIFSK